MTQTMITQGDNKFLHIVKTVEWLIENTSVSVFDPVRFEGYQREISDSHCEKIVAYLRKQFYLPTPIICACDDKLNDNTQLRIVDGQHRIHAFRKLKEQYRERFEEIKDYEISVIVMEQVALDKEIDTFITINKTSKRVDTSLAYVLKNKLNFERDSSALSISKLDYVAVELAVSMNENNPSWENRISLTGGVNKKTPQVISLNSFVKATRRLVGHLDKKKIIDVSWNNSEEVENCIYEVQNILDNLWRAVMEKWPTLFERDDSYLRIIQGPIGYSSITRFIANEIKLVDMNSGEKQLSDINYLITLWINSIDLTEEVWYPGNKFSKLTSESGYNIIVSDIKKSMK